MTDKGSCGKEIVHCARHNAASGVAQSVEQVAVNHWVGGSNPSTRAKKGRYSLRIATFFVFRTALRKRWNLCLRSCQNAIGKAGAFVRVRPPPLPRRPLVPLPQHLRESSLNKAHMRTPRDNALCGKACSQVDRRRAWNQSDRKSGSICQYPVCIVPPAFDRTIVQQST